MIANQIYVGILNISNDVIFRPPSARACKAVNGESGEVLIKFKRSVHVLTWLNHYFRSLDVKGPISRGRGSLNYIVVEFQAERQVDVTSKKSK